MKSFFEKLDSRLTGNKLYDWYYSQIWARIWRVFMYYPQEFKSKIKKSHQRAKFGISDEDCWSVSDWFYETLCEACKRFIKDEYGKEEPDWNTWLCTTHDKALYERLNNYISSYQEYKKHLLDDSKRLLELEKEREKIHKLAAKIVKDDIESLWT